VEEGRRGWRNTWTVLLYAAKAHPGPATAQFTTGPIRFRFFFFNSWIFILS